MNLTKLWKCKGCKKFTFYEGWPGKRPGTAGRSGEGRRGGAMGVKDDGEGHWRRATLGCERGRERETLGLREGEK